MTQMTQMTQEKLAAVVPPFQVINVAWWLATAYRHEWAVAMPDGPWEGISIADINAHTLAHRGNSLPGISFPDYYVKDGGAVVLTHTTATGRTSWQIQEVEEVLPPGPGEVGCRRHHLWWSAWISRPAGDVLRMERWGTGPVEVTRLDGPELFTRHVYAAAEFLSAAGLTAAEVLVALASMYVDATPG